MLYLLDFIKNNKNWEELLTQDPYNLKISRDNGYIMFKYNQLSSDFSLPEVKEARGIIFKESTWECVCHAFDKFMNAEEQNSDLATIDWSTASVQKKIDGSLMKVWYDNGWNISTNGLIDAFKAPLECANKELNSFGKLFLYCLHSMGINEHDFFGRLAAGATYIFEMVSPYNRVVIDYKEPRLYFLGLRDLKTNQEYFIDKSNESGIDIIIESIEDLLPIPTRYSLKTFDEVKTAANALPWDEEGYVVCDGNFNRVKIKSPEYVLAHRGRTNGNVSDLRLIDLILQNETSEFLVYAAEYTDRLSYLDKAMKKFEIDVNAAIIAINPDSYSTRKELAENVKKLPSYMQGFVFKYDKLEDAFARLSPSQWKRILEKRGDL